MWTCGKGKGLAVFGVIKGQIAFYWSCVNAINTDQHKGGHKCWNPMGKSHWDLILYFYFYFFHFHFGLFYYVFYCCLLSKFYSKISNKTNKKKRSDETQCDHIHLLDATVGSSCPTLVAVSPQAHTPHPNPRPSHHPPLPLPPVLTQTQLGGTEIVAVCNAVSGAIRGC